MMQVEGSARTAVVLVTDYALKLSQEKVATFLLANCGNLDRDSVALVARHPRRPVVNVGDLGFPSLTAYVKRFNRLLVDCHLYDKPTISASQWSGLLVRAEQQGIRYLFWIVSDPVGDWSPVSANHNVPRDCWPPSVSQLWKLSSDMTLTLGVELPPVTASTFTPKPMSLPQARDGKALWRTPRVSGTQAVTDVAKQASSTVNRCETKGDAKKSS